MLREKLDMDGEYRVIYDFDGSAIHFLLITITNQDFGKMLYRCNILK